MTEKKKQKNPFFSCFSPPDGCLQYHSELDGRFTTFNFVPTTTINENHLANQQYEKEMPISSINIPEIHIIIVVFATFVVVVVVAAAAAVIVAVIVAAAAFFPNCS